MLNYAQWRSNAEFEAFARHPQIVRLQAAIEVARTERGPKAIAYRAVHSIAAA